jgi:hypothetical protein
MPTGENIMSAGIDYGLGKANIDLKSGIRYGVISQNSVLQAWCDNAEPEYPEPEEGEDEDSYCDCDPVGWSYEGEGYKLIDCLDTDIMVLESPFYTFAQFCSPCVPGAGNLDHAMPDGVKCYCLGHDWFEDGKAPYPVYRVSDNYIVNPEEGA